MAVNLSFIGGAGWQFLDDDGNPLSGGKIYTYAAGTTTPQTTYTSRTGAIANTNPIILDAAGRTPEQIWSTEGLLYKYVVADSSDVIIRTWDNIGGSVVASDLAADLASTTDNAKGDALVGFKQANASGFYADAVGRTVSAKLQEIYSVKDFGAVGDGIADDSTAIQDAIDAAPSGGVVWVPPGNYACGTMLTTGNKTLFILSGASIFRPSTSVSTDPVIWLNASNAGIIGQGRFSRVTSQNRSPYGVIRIGHENMTVSHANVTYCFVKNIAVGGSTVYGQTTGDPDQNIAIYNPQFGGLASYFHTLQSLWLFSSNTAIGLHGYANANIISDIQIYRVGNGTSNTYRKAIHVDGAQENMISDVFHHFSPDSYTIYMNENDNTGNGGSVHNPTWNTIYAITSEQGGSAARGAYIESSGGNNMIWNIRNTATGNFYYSGFANTNAIITSNRSLSFENGIFVNSNATNLNVTPDGINTAVSVDTNGLLTGFLADRKTTIGSTTIQSATALKRDLTSDGATVSFTLSCNAQASVYRHGFVYLICASQDSGTTTAHTAWFLLPCRSSLADAYPVVNTTPSDSGGNTGSYTITYSAGVLTIAAAGTHDDLIVDIKFALANINNVNIT